MVLSATEYNLSWPNLILLENIRFSHRVFSEFFTSPEMSTIKKVAGFIFLPLLLSDPRGIQTHNLLIRSQMLYSVELGDLPF